MFGHLGSSGNFIGPLLVAWVNELKLGRIRVYFEAISSSASVLNSCFSIAKLLAGLFFQSLLPLPGVHPISPKLTQCHPRFGRGSQFGSCFCWLLIADC